MNKSIQPRCAGIVVFDANCEYVVIVKNHKNNYGFGKGKLEKNESHIAGAFRENKEETGLLPKDVEVIPYVHIDELSNAGNPSIRYYVAKLIGNKTDYKLKQEDGDEIDEVKWYKIDVAIKLLFDKRKIVLTEAIKYFNNATTFINGSDMLKDIKN